ncbi:hypothetical protein I3843_03G032300 [Carya illinoinensis]|uniref:Uncharacterized protein n=1 Tax=Carya illinoinensis TaxID=32201 RepID=A0A8T1QZ84_CARIL|nr:uncharacterized protein LOC122302560 [Carya illinoinensis]KAG6659454.1 hypothetical protein CIPAW_03G036300 [Carya illinoinensis]KAG6719903.1 hypothetical protein I3842_03G030600 [Carya illinoinensis]KAG7985564.1 hypothetical protein I3843_03G032300 [Carya illinoinensis]
MSLGKAPETSPQVNDDDTHDLLFAKRGCCSWIPCLGSTPGSTIGSSWWERIKKAESEDRWWTRGWKKFQEWSELVARPKWKTFVHRFKKNRTGLEATDGHGKFNYDPMSYALNFDEGMGQNNHLDEDYLGRDFSCRYASIPASAKSSMDLGKDAPEFT